MYVLQLMDSYAPSYALLVGGLCELLALGWIYGKYQNATSSSHCMMFFLKIFATT